MKKYQLEIKFKESEEYKKSLFVVNKLLEAGFKAYFVGGCVRDLLMGIEAKDFDVVTNATPTQIKSIFRRTISVGEQFGIIVVMIDSVQVEVATFRCDTSYSDGRRPESVVFSTEVEDVERRDYTVNALLYDTKNNEIIDYVNGYEDLQKGILKAIGKASERFDEDKLRMLRAVRFSSRLNFKIEEETYKSIKEFAKDITVISKERIREEITKILVGNNPRYGIELMYETGLLKEVLPEVYNMYGVEQPPEFHPEGDVFAHTMLMLDLIKEVKDNIKCYEEFCWGVLLHDIGKVPTYTVSDRIRFNNHDWVGSKMAEKLCRRLKFSKKSTDYIVALVRDHMKFIAMPEMRKSTLKKFIRTEFYNDLHKLLWIDCVGSHGDLELYNLTLKINEEIGEEPLRPKPLIGGDDLIALGLTPSKIFTEILNEVENLQLDGKISTKEEAIEFVRGII